MKLKELLSVYNFRNIIGEDDTDTSIVRIYPYQWDSNNYFEIGVYDFGEENILQSVIKKDIMDKEVDCFRINRYGDLTIYLLDDEKEGK